jgi:hypothetical protein
MTFCAALPLRAQPTEADARFLQDIWAVIGFVSKETAREAHGKCVALSERLKAMTGVDSVQRLYFEAEIENCISYAMNNGDFSDATGDQCTYHFSYATKLAKVIEDGRGKPGFTSDLMYALGDRLRTATSIGPGTGCRSDYSVFQPAIAMAFEEAAKPPSESPYKLSDDLSAMARTVTPETAREIQKACLDKAADIDAVPDRPPAERLFYEGLIEDCVARAMVTGNYSDESGDVCTHHFRFAQKYAEGAKAAKGDPRVEERFALIMKGELEIAKRQGPQMGCKQDYSALQAE